MKCRLLILVVLFITVCSFLIYINHEASSQAYSIQVSFIDVDQGDSALIQNAEGYNILIDGGVKAEGPTVLAYLRNNGVYTINAIVASHADADHIGGLISVLNATDIAVDSVIYNGYPGDTQTWSDFVTAVTNEGLSLIPAQFPGELQWGTTTAYILNPISGLINPETNDASLVLLFDHVEMDFLFTGDIDLAVESQVIARETPIAADVLKVAHHGSNYSTSMEFLNAVQPSDSIISVGQNSYGHPGANTLARLLASGTTIWRTDRSGTIIVTSSDGISYQVIPSITGQYFFLPIINRNEAQSSTPTPPGTFEYTVQQGDSLASIASQFNSDIPTLLALNPAIDPIQLIIYVGQIILVPVPPTGNIVVTTIFYNGFGQNEPDEYVEIRNDENYPIQLEGWKLSDIANHVYTFPNYAIQPGQVCRIYTNEYHPEWCGFDYSYGSSIWNNSGDCAYLRDFQSILIDDYCY